MASHQQNKESKNHTLNLIRDAIPATYPNFLPTLKKGRAVLRFLIIKKKCLILLLNILPTIRQFYPPYS
jgi:hypothetical protein